MKKYIYALALAAVFLGCTEESPVTNPPVSHEPVVIEHGTYAKGADVSWLTQMEKEGYTFYNAARVEKECMQLLRDDCGVNAIRLRVWVNPADGWNNVDDVVVKARRATRLGMRVMIDFHFSDTWADPGNQVTPAEWANYNFEELHQAVIMHVTEVLQSLQKAGVEPDWVQIGNETRNGFMYPLGNIGDHPDNFAKLVSDAHSTIKALLPECKTIVHIDQGNNWYRYTHVFDVLKAKNAQYDMIGISVYPEANSWRRTIDDAIANMKKATATYGKPCMVCEIGLDAEAVAEATEMMAYLDKACREGASEGIFYWEPQAPLGYNGGYRKGCFLDNAPTTALDCWK